MASADGLSLQAVRFSGKGMASLPMSYCCHSLADIRGRKANTGRGDNCQGPKLSCDLILEAHALALGMSAQKNELIALTRALQLAAEKLLINTQTLNMFLPLFMYTGPYIYIYIYIYIYMTKNNLKPSHRLLTSEFRQG
jgi:hypothetical protein